MQTTPSPSPSPAISRQKSESDLFFPSSDSEEEPDRDGLKPSTEAEHRMPSPSGSKAFNGSASGSRPRSPLFADSGETLVNGNHSGRGHKSTKSQDSDIIAVDPPPSSKTVEAGPSRSLKRPSPPSRASSFQVPEGFSGGYLGEFVCEGWSLSKGKGYCSPGSKIVFERPKAKSAPPEPKTTIGKGEKVGPGKLVGGKMVNSKGKQMTLGSMMSKKPSPAPSKKSGTKPTVDSVIRFRNDRGFEVGRLSVTEASFLVHLLDTDIISLTGHVIDCPQSLSTGCTILLNVKVFLTRKAFEKPDKANREENGTFWQEQKETAEEEAMRQRKEALGSLFSEISYGPINRCLGSYAQVA